MRIEIYLYQVSTDIAIKLCMLTVVFFNSYLEKSRSLVINVKVNNIKTCKETVSILQFCL